MLHSAQRTCQTVPRIVRTLLSASDPLPVLLRRARRGVQLVSRARERGGNFSNNSQRERAIGVGFGSERFEQPLQTQGEGLV